jgi:hypothetical protein
MISNLTLSRGLLCAFLLLASSSAEASISRFDPTRYNIRSFSQYSKVHSDTNSAVSSWAPVRDYLKETKVAGCSKKQWYFKRNLSNVFVGSMFFLVVLALTLIFSKGMVFFLWILLCLPSISIIHETEPWWLFMILSLPCIILTKDFPRARKGLAVICLAALVVAFLAMKLIDLNRFAYMDDYSFPEYLVSSTSTNIVVVHEKMDLPYDKYGKYRKQLLFKNGRITTVRTNELGTLLQEQAEEIRMFKQGTTPKNPE